MMMTISTVCNLVGCFAGVISAVLKADPPKDQGPVVQNLYHGENDHHLEDDGDDDDYDDGCLKKKVRTNLKPPLAYRV